MVETQSKSLAKPEREMDAPAVWQAPLEGLHREVDRLFEEFRKDVWQPTFRSLRFGFEPFWRRGPGWDVGPSVDIVEKEGAYEVTAELPGMDEKNIDVKESNGSLTIKGEKKEEKEERKKDYYLHERRFGSFERSFKIPEGVDKEKIEASFKNGILKVSLPKSPEAKKAEKKIEVKAV